MPTLFNLIYYSLCDKIIIALVVVLISATSMGAWIAWSLHCDAKERDEEQ